jgi:catechol 2,3-dioxygenase
VAAHLVGRAGIEGPALVLARVDKEKERTMKIKELGHLVLYVKDVERSAAFYRDVLGWDVVFPTTLGTPAAAFSSGRTHHELLLIEVGEGATPQPRGRHLGLYHFGLKVGDTDEELREAVARLEEAGVPIVGSSDHTVTHSLYILDPDGNEIELYIDVAGVDWKTDPMLVMAPVRPLAL